MCGQLKMEFKRISKCFEKEAVCREDMIRKLQGELQNAFSFIKESFGENQEMLLFVTGITADKSMTSFIAGNGCPAYFEHSEMLYIIKKKMNCEKRVWRQCMMDYRKNDVTGYNSLSQTAVGNGCLYII